jgi:hypothetical protein
MNNGSKFIKKLINYVRRQSDANHYANFVIENVKENSIFFQLSNIIAIQLVINQEFMLAVVRLTRQIKKFFHL